MTNAPDAAALLRAYDDQLRTEGELNRAVDVQRHGPLWWARFDRGGFVTYQDLGGARGDELDALIEATIAHYRDDTDVPELEWKTRGHDLPADLPQRLLAHGFEAEDDETVMVGEASALALDLPLPDGVTLRRAGDGAYLRTDIERSLAMQSAVFGGGGPTVEGTLKTLAEGNGDVEVWLAEADGEVICAGRLDRVRGTDFAGIWGGACREDYRGRGIYRALTAARARSALRLGARYINSDCTEMSRPILEKSGLVKVTTTTPFIWQR